MLSKAGFIVLHQTLCLAYCVETGFLTNKDERWPIKFFNRDIIEMGKGHAEAILLYKGILISTYRRPCLKQHGRLSANKNRMKLRNRVNKSVSKGTGSKDQEIPNNFCWMQKPVKKYFQKPGTCG